MANRPRTRSRKSKSERQETSRRDPRTRLRELHDKIGKATDEDIDRLADAAAAGDEDAVRLLGACLTYEDLVRITGTSRRWISDWRARGELRVRKIGGRSLIRLVDWLRFIEDPRWDHTPERAGGAA